MRQIAEVRNYRELQAVLRARSEEMEITRLASDHDSGLPSGYSAKLLAPVPIRNLGMSSLGALLGLLKLKLVVVEDCPRGG